MTLPKVKSREALQLS